MNKRSKNKLKKTAINCAQMLIDQLGEDTEFMIVVNHGTGHCTICTNPLEIAKSMMVNIVDETSSNREAIYNIVKTAAASLLLCKDIDFHKDFEDIMSDCLMDSLTK